MDNAIRASIWTRQETNLLLDLWEQETRRQNLDGTARNYKVHQRISQVLVTKGYCRSPMQVRERLKRLRREFRESRRCEYYDRVAAIMASKAESNGDVMTHDGADMGANGTIPEGRLTIDDDMDYPEERHSTNGVSREEESVLLQRRTVQLLSALVEGQRRTQKSTVCFQRQMLQNMHVMATSMQTVAGALARACLYMPPPERGPDGGCSPSYAASLLEHDDLTESRDGDSPQPRSYVKDEPSD
ncbi:hypothetical protein IscW_ISCW011908 [Ixodes scapularis]|uniref:Myb/SANT-like DNA-binding domain-containing protein n=1 Tax=Ixodes scapularis TaxID=6945 RepID=B7QFE1_IXOSC|nr:hypothetical protein IscW_ISCW011908 [Ixodes scapularis]|eukprot:XP_002414255.1 hypothetical protein IscW_ISCW011908 [Ixodes scapularis]